MNIMQKLIFMLLIACSSSVLANEEQSNFIYEYPEFYSQYQLEKIQTKLNENYKRMLAQFNLESINSIKVIIWDDQTQYLMDQKKAIGQSFFGSTGYVHYSRSNNMQEIRLLHNRNIAQTALHEFAHIVSLAINPNFANNPRWLWEAVAIKYSENNWSYAKSPNRILKQLDSYESQLNASFNQNTGIYDVGYTITEFIENKWGKEGVIKLIKTNGDLKKVTDLSYEQFMKQWKDFVQLKYAK